MPRTMGAAPKQLGAAAPSATVSALWLLVALELVTIGALRRYFRKHHGG